MKTYTFLKYASKMVMVTLLACSTISARAAFLAPGPASLYPAPGEPDLPIGALVASTGPLAFSSGPVAGTLISEVWTADPSNPFGPGALTFTYRVSNTSVAAAIHRLTVSDFTPFLTDASFSTIAAPGLAPTWIDRTTPDVIGFEFAGIPVGPGSLLPGMTSALLVIQTSATIYAPSIANVIDGSVASVASFAPIPAVIPEPTTLALASLAGATMLLARRRK